MGYRIVYGEDDRTRTDHAATGRRLQVFTALCLLIFTLAVKIFWSRGATVLQEVFLPGQPGVTEQAASDLLMRIRAGTGFEDALRTFCLDILENGN